jgi:hypothetical protein
MSAHPIYKEVVDLVTPVMVLARGGIVYIRQENQTILLSDTAVEQLSETLMKAGAASIRARGGDAPVRHTLAARIAAAAPVASPFPADPDYEIEADPFSPAASQEHATTPQPVPGDAGSLKESTS